MLTDKPPRKASLRQQYERSDSMRSFALPDEPLLQRYAADLEVALKREDKRAAELLCNKLAQSVCASYGAAPPVVRVLGVRPLEESEDGWVDETFGDYHFKSQRIRLWMRTAVLEKVTAYGTFLSTLCHEICHHLDVVHFDLPNTYHTRGFYERAGLLYHHLRGTPVRPLVWDALSNGTYRINWPQTMRGAGSAGRAAAPS